MTNSEKAYEISQSQLIEDGIWHYATAEIAAIEMAEWKDQQFKSVLESEIERMKVDYPDTSTIQIRRYLEGLVEKLFKEE